MKCLAHGMSNAATDGIWQWIWDNANDISQIAQNPEQHNRPKKMRAYRRKAKKQLPRMDEMHMIREADGSIKVRHSCPRQKQGREILFSQVSLKVLLNENVSACKVNICICIISQLAEIIEVHQSRHPCQVQTQDLVLWIDGIQESRSNKVSLNVFACYFPGCRLIYPVCIQRPSPTMPVEQKQEQEQLALRCIVEEIQYVYLFNYSWNMAPINCTVFLTVRLLGLRLQYISADAPKRASIRKFKNHNSYRGCDFCVIRGDRLELTKQRPQKKRKRGGNAQDAPEDADAEDEENNEEKRPGKMTFPSVTDSADQRDHQCTLDLLENNDVGLMNEYCIKGKSEMFALMGFDVILHIPLDPMHQWDLGVVKRALE